MSPKKKLILAMVVIWAAIFVASYLMSTRIEGPRNLDTGFKRLDVLARYQLVAFAIALMSAVAGILWRRDGKRIMLIGLSPLLITVLVVVAIVGGTMIFNPPLTPEEAYQPPKQTTSAVGLPAQN